MWKQITTASIVIVTFGVIIIGNMHFKEKIRKATESAQAVEAAVPSEEKQAEEAQIVYESYMRNMPASLQDKLKQAIEAKTQLHLVIAGDEAVGDAPERWPMLLAVKLQEAYGADLFRVTVKSYPQKTTQQWIDEGIYNEIVSLQPDVLLYEPALLTDAGEWERETTVQNVSFLLGEIGKGVPGAVSLVQPPHPLHRAVNYPETVQLLKETMNANGYTYIEHWTGWPAADSDELLNYLNEPDGWPSLEGEKVWANALANYFIARTP